jgi:membrane protein implicated in regulation of membrane protease activity
MLSVIVAVAALGIAALSVVGGPMSYGLIGVACATLYLVVVGRAALREIKWSDGERGLCKAQLRRVQAKAAIKR